MKVLITGADGFLGRNLRLHLSERKDIEIVCFTRQHNVTQFARMLNGVDFVFHLAGVNRPQDPQEFDVGNTDLTHALCQAVGDYAAGGKSIPIVFTSSAQAGSENPYGHSKLAAEASMFAMSARHGVPVHVFRLPNVFGKWCKPNYNSVVATFCHNVAHDIPIHVNDPSKSLTLVYVDDVMLRFMQLMDGADAIFGSDGFSSIAPQYTATLGELAAQIQAFKASRQNLVSQRVGTGLVRALYATYVSYLSVDIFSYNVPQYADSRGVFVEMLKTPDCGQFSFFTAYPGITRGGHYHHSKTEKFLVIKGQARFKFRQMHSGVTHEIVTSGVLSEVVETVPGWTHDITNIGTDELVVMLWANEIFDRQRPDTFACAV